MEIPKSWVDLSAEVVRKGRLVMLIGRVDTGKTTLCRYLIGEAVREGIKSAAVDADVGQSWIGPPTCIGMKLAFESEEELGDEPDGIYFVGAISPPGHLLDCVVGTRLMVDEARSLGAEFVVVDTTGLVDGDIGLALKRSKILSVTPTDIVLIQDRSELEPLAREIERIERWRLHRMKRADRVTRKSHQLRVSHRNAMFERYFSGCVPTKFDFSDLRSQRSLFLNGDPLPERELKVLSHLIGDIVLYAESSGDHLFAVTPDRVRREGIERACRAMRLSRFELRQPDWFDGLLVGLLDRQGKTISLGIIEEVDFASRKLTIICQPDSEETAIVQFSRFKMR
jgi:polynucleotide 5'-hydroxyl-kinase GRC3/NOL9